MAREAENSWIGPDRVMLRKDRLVIHSPVEMDAWKVRAHRKILIRFRGESWKLARKIRCGPTRWRYELEPWAPGPMERPGGEIHYGPEYVAQRGREIAERRKLERAAIGLLLLSPFVGLLGSGTKRALENRYGIDPVAATRRSLYLEYGVLLSTGVLLSIGAMLVALGSSSPWPIEPLGIVFLAVLPDTVVRYGRLIEADRYPPGFYQWILGLRRR